ncbi:hypothetical protein DYADSP32_2227, partial [Dyadobacter sp. 32]
YDLVSKTCKCVPLVDSGNSGEFIDDPIYALHFGFRPASNRLGL